MSHSGWQCTDEDWYRQEAERSKAQGPSNFRLRWLCHPVALIGWRTDARRKGPYAPDFNDWLKTRKAQRQDRRRTGS